MELDDFAAVVIGRNEGERLIACLRSIKSIVSCIVYVDSGSTDGSRQAAEQLGAKVVNLDPCVPFTAARARNEGFALLHQIRPDIQFIQFVDGDCELCDGWLIAASEFMKHRGDVALVCGRRRERDIAASIYNKLCDLEWDTPIGQADACGGDALVRVRAFASVGGYCAQLIAGEEPELCLRLSQRGWKLWRLDVEMTRHDAAITRFGQWWLRTVRYGYGITQLLSCHGRSSSQTWKRQFDRSIFWGGALPTVIIIASYFNLLALVALVVYPLQICKIAIARGRSSKMSWLYASFVTLAKFAEFQGILKFLWHRLHRRSGEIIEYK